MSESKKLFEGDSHVLVVPAELGIADLLVVVVLVVVVLLLLLLVPRPVLDIGAMSGPCDGLFFGVGN